QYYLKGIAFGLFLSARFEKSWWKYPHSRGYRVIMLDIGHASQTVLLTATTLGLNTWLSAAFNDTGVDELLGIQNNSEASLFFIGVGHGDNSSLNPTMIDMLKETPKE
ncbi:MAG: nitroreductase family protein, partial [Alphaproteobacteria bacterium]|nr:nitroreductase family protein [Alphaproteobacteria bacterium]